MDKKINTLLEARIQEISKEEAHKTREQFVKRNTWLGAYTPATNIFGIGEPIDWDGKILELSRIRMTDVATLANQPVQDDPLTTDLDEQKDQQADGTNVLHTIDDTNGERTGHLVLVTGFTVKIRAAVTELNVNAQGVEIPDDVIVKYAIYRVRDDYAGGPTVPPTAKQLLTWRPWNYSAAIDDKLQIETYRYKKQRICGGKLRLTYSQVRPNVKFHEQNVRFANPHKLEYAVSDQSGERPLHFKYYLAVRSTAHQQGGPINLVPKVTCMTQLRYTMP